MDNAVGAPGTPKPNGKRGLYLQALITLAPGLFLCPEIGFINGMGALRGRDEKHLLYIGGKWQIDFT
jgi:hypothetical protein